MNEITCRGCGRYESECTCNLLTTDKVKLQARIAELEALILTEEEAEKLIDVMSDYEDNVDTEAPNWWKHTKTKLQAIIEGNR